MKGGEMASEWLVRTEWIGRGMYRTSVAHHHDQRAAERAGLQTACLSGARYVAVEGPGAVVTLDWDRYTNKARRYGRYLGVCGNEREELDGQVCTGEVYAPASAVQSRCFECGAWEGVLSPVRRPYWEALGLPWPRYLT